MGWRVQHWVAAAEVLQFNYLPQECQQMQVICDACGGLRLRISRLQNRENLENAPSAVLKYLEEFKRPYLTIF